MKFAHMADCHIGGWREQKMRDLSLEAFKKAIDISIEEHVDFLLISGDLFNNALPGIDSLKFAVQHLQRLKTKSIPVYIIPGSHDFSPSGKTMLDVLEETQLVKNVVQADRELTEKYQKLVLKFTEDKNAKITGMVGRKGMLEKSNYESLHHETLEKEEGFKIFMFHTAISELKPKELVEMESCPISLLPKGFDYYAGGHVHIVENTNLEGYKNVVYPGPTFPNNFRELTQLHHGGFYIYDKGELQYKELKLKGVFNLQLDCNGMTPKEVQEKIYQNLQEDLNDMIVTLKLTGKLESGKLSEIDTKEIITHLYEKGAYFVMKNTSSLTSKEFEEVSVKQGSIEDMENDIIKEHGGQFNLGIPHEDQLKLIKELLNNFHNDKKEGETVASFEERIRKDTDHILNL